MAKDKSKGKLQESELPVQKSEVLDLAKFELNNALIDHFTSNQKETGIKVDKSWNVKFMPTRISIFDTFLGGGLPEDRITMYVGRSGCGKTTKAMNDVGAFQKQHNGKCIILYIDNEQSFTPIRLAACGFDFYNPDTQFMVINECLEKVFAAIDNVVKFKESVKQYENYPTLIVWDSLANTQPEKLETSNDPEKLIGIRARYLSVAIPKYLPIFRKYNMTLILINQLRRKINMGYIQQANDLRYMGGEEKTIPGGEALIFNCHNIVFFKEKDLFTTEKYGFDGVKVIAKCLKNRSFSPNIPIELIFKYSTGYDEFWTNYFNLVDAKIIRNGNPCKMDDYDDKQFSSFRLKNAEEVYNSDPEFKRVFDIHVEKFIQDFKDKNNQYAKIIDDKELVAAAFIDVDDEEPSDMITNDDISNDSSPMIQPPDIKVSTPQVSTVIEPPQIKIEIPTN